MPAPFPIEAPCRDSYAVGMAQAATRSAGVGVGTAAMTGALAGP